MEGICTEDGATPAAFTAKDAKDAKENKLRIFALEREFFEWFCRPENLRGKRGFPGLVMVMRGIRPAPTAFGELPQIRESVYD